MKFSKKTAHRLIVSLAMLAPVIYLFGAMFLGLAGAHGEKIYEDEIIIDQTPTYEELMTPENFRYEAFDWNNESGYQRVGFSLGEIGWDTDLSEYIYPYGASNGVWIEQPVQNGGLGFVGDVWSKSFIGLLLSYSNDSAYVDDFAYVGLGNSQFYFCCYCVGDTSLLAFVGFVDASDNNPVSWTLTYRWDSFNEEWVSGFNSFDDTFYYVYFDDGGHSPQEFDDNLKSYFVPSVRSVEVSSSTYTASIFGQFFPHDNFVERMGVNALSANPIGFAPFGTFLSYLDVNVFHAANSQIALMLYGMVYWSLHVIIADLVYHVAVFIPNLIQRVFDWFGQKGLDDD